VEMGENLQTGNNWPSPKSVLLLLEELKKENKQLHFVEKEWSLIFQKEFFKYISLKKKKKKKERMKKNLKVKLRSIIDLIEARVLLHNTDTLKISLGVMYSIINP
jgi:hypothetical protein